MSVHHDCGSMMLTSSEPERTQCPSVDEQISKTLSMQTTEYYPAIKEQSSDTRYMDETCKTSC